jgi:restriction system protein
MKKLPTRKELLEPTVQVFEELGGSANTDEIYEKIVEKLELTDSVVEIVNGKTGQSALQYDLSWVRWILKKQGVLSNIGRGLWVLNRNQPKNIIASIKETKINKFDEKAAEEEIADSEEWKKTVIEIINEKMSPNAFERLIQRILREVGFSQVEVTGRTGDGGIDGKGIAKINGILSFHVIFQCKKYKGKVSSSDMRDFRGAMVGRTDKGLFITTGTFTREAVREANRDGAPAIDLMDGVKIAEKLKELNLGVKTELKEYMSVDEKWFETF